MCVLIFKLETSFGLFMGLNTLQIQPILDVKLGKVCGLKAIEYMRELSLRNVIFEMDVKLLLRSF